MKKSPHHIDATVALRASEQIRDIAFTNNSPTSDHLGILLEICLTLSSITGCLRHHAKVMSGYNAGREAI